MCTAACPRRWQTDHVAAGSTRFIREHGSVATLLQGSILPVAGAEQSRDRRARVDAAEARGTQDSSAARPDATKGWCAVMWWYGDGGPGAWGWVMMILGMVAFWGLVIYAGVRLARSSTRDDRRRGQTPSPEDVLAERFARGEIDEQEYRERLDVLRTHQRPRRA